MEAALSSFIIIFSTLLPILDPFGGCMFFLALTPGITDEQRAMMTRRIVMYSAIILFASLFAGTLILSFFGISMGILRMCGGLLICSAGWKNLNAPSRVDQPIDVQPTHSTEKLMSMAFYPITLPLTMGPGVISVVCSLGTGIFTDGWESFIGMMLASLAALAVVYVCYRNCDRIGRAAGRAGADALSRIFSFILICLGTGVFWKGLTDEVAAYLAG